MGQSISTERDRSLSSLEREKSTNLQEIRRSAQERASKVENSSMSEIEQYQSRAEMLKAKISELQSTLSALPSDHPESKKLKKTLASLKKDLAITKSIITTKRIRMRSQIQMVRFRAKMQEKMRLIKYSERKSKLIREFAERIMQTQQNQMAMSAAQSSGGMLPGGSSGRGMKMTSPELGVGAG